MKPIYFKEEQRPKKVIKGYLLIIGFAVFPFLLAFIAAGIGYCMGCSINEAGTDDCVRLGIPFGMVLNPLGASFWLFLITIPIGCIAFIAWTIIGIHDAIYHNSNR